MALITRVSRLFRADIHEVLDRVEEPDILLKQAVRDMEEELNADERRRQMLAHELGQLEDRKNEFEKSVTRIDEELDLCLSSGKENLARGLVKRKLEAERYLEFLERRRETLNRKQSVLQKRIEDNRSRLEAMRQKAEILTQDKAVGESDENWLQTGFDTRFVVGEEDVEVALLREKRKRAGS